MFDLVTQEDLSLPLLKEIKPLLDCSLEGCQKWKIYENQVVLQSPDFFYKIYVGNINENNLFLFNIRDTFGAIYREVFNLDWNVFTFKNENYMIQVEKREKVKVCDPIDFTFEELFRRYNETLKLVEDRLDFARITFQLKQYIPTLFRIKLLRDCINKFQDYGMTKDGKVILLDDSDFFVTIADKNGDTILAKNNAYEVNTKSGSKLLLPQSKESITLNHFDECSFKWILVDNNRTGEIQDKLCLLKDLRNKMLQDNLKFLITGHLETSLVGKSEHLFIDKDIMDEEGDEIDLVTFQK